MTDRLTNEELAAIRRTYVDKDEYPPLTDDMRRLLDDLKQARMFSEQALVGWFIAEHGYVAVDPDESIPRSVWAEWDAWTASLGRSPGPVAPHMKKLEDKCDDLAEQVKKLLAERDDLWRERTALKEQILYDLPETRDHGQEIKRLKDRINEMLGVRKGEGARPDTKSLVAQIRKAASKWARSLPESDSRDLLVIIDELGAPGKGQLVWDLKKSRAEVERLQDLLADRHASERAELNPMKAVGGEDG